MENTYQPLQSYLQNNNQTFSMDNLKTLAGSKGISNYTGTDAQNKQLAGLLNTNSGITQPTAPANASVVSNDGMQKQVAEITNKYQNYTGQMQPQVQQTNQQTQTQQPQAQIDYRTAPYQQDPETGVKAYYNPTSGAYDQYETKGGIVNYGGISVPSEQINDPALRAVIDNQLKARTTGKADLDAQLEAIKNRFTQYRQQQQDITNSGAAQANNALLQSGAGNRGSVAQYASATADARVNSIMSDGIKKLQELDNDEQTLISEAHRAYNVQDFKQLDYINGLIEQKRQEQLTASKEINKGIATGTAQAQKDLSIAQAYETYGNDPIAILKAVNAQGNGDITAKDVTGAIESLTNQKGLDELALQISKNGGDPSVIKGAKNISQAIELAGNSLNTPSNQVVKLGNSAYLIDKNTGKVTQSFGVPIQSVASKTAVAGGVPASTTTGKYSSDLDALIGNTINTIPSKFGQTSFKESVAKARDDADKISTVATVLLKNAPSEERKDFVNQTVGIKQIDKALALLDTGVQTGRLEAATQYAYNLAGKDFDPKLAQLNQLITSAIQPYRNSVTGAAWGDQEEAEYQQLFGSTKYSPAELRQRLLGIKEIMKDKSTGALRAYVDPLSQYADPFNTTTNQNIIPKNGMSDRDYVEKTVSSQPIPYDKLINDTPQGSIPVVDNATGQVGYIPIGEYSSTLYTKL